MKTKQTIAVIGATGNMGSAISRALSNANYRLLLFAKDQAKLQTLVEEIRKRNAVADIESVDCSVNASWEADIILLAVPYQTEKEIAEKIREVANQKVVVSISNPLDTSFNGMLTEPDTSAAEELQKQLPHSKVVKAFNTTFAADFSTPVIDGKQVDSFIAGNHEEALETASELVVAAGFYPILAGDLSVSRTLENMALLLIQETIKSNYDWLAGWKVLHH
ncbi:NAD(P)-binding domain-containing protein [Cytophagaceae bacterium DM2B3-1]|uniref:NAD(P)-binding domain-containing protein n=1 Tax=Xanthocytophaga flava TaxID=3048013 RepID=A0ABT7CGP9_9BACT|nr:NAD(P)-binding domain-containing protein [Xanthocytophaga flavus]MDJ1471097.1 NAD(P)-binding domain-containing protein [Xanthocytophaga flavus]MDJ1492916.1 NAD(P)-binding domain-containing protein [Xanthocytophaga flavus]